jgi:hypothetical protein
VLLDGEAFILQVQGVFTRIRSGATLVMDGGDASRSILLRWRRRRQKQCRRKLRSRSIQVPATEGMKNP